MRNQILPRNRNKNRENVKKNPPCEDPVKNCLSAGPMNCGAGMRPRAILCFIHPSAASACQPLSFSTKHLRASYTHDSTSIKICLKTRVAYFYRINGIKKYVK
ncbi:hypothetical protein CEXT_634711 [Caerostris extrusa]|uniref:Uncharacterized protein n=1 Tax=Caerostris extrusa TaxID=172846 RepID=A0AAV4VWS1_CAEEX|nr:hypothetical protein CEXT_634711 [Caerostris extrusa]